MKKSLLLLIVIFISSFSIAQKINVEYNIKDQDIKDILEVLGVQTLKFEFPKEVKGRSFKIIIKEYHEGDLISSSETLYFDRISKDDEGLKAIMHNKTDSTESLSLRSKFINANEVFKLRYNRSKYDWTSLIDSDSEVDLNSEIPFLTFTYQPTTKDNPNHWIFCALPKLARDYKNWHSLVSVKHFFIFFIKFDETE